LIPRRAYARRQGDEEVPTLRHKPGGAITDKRRGRTPIGVRPRS